MEFKKSQSDSERGAALPTVILIMTLLGLACIFLLKGVTATSGETSDVLSETKAYYSAESGIQSTINVLRNNSLATYKKAVDPAFSNAALDPSTNARLSAFLPYASSTDANSRVVLKDDLPSNYQAYSVEVYDPDETQASMTFVGSLPATSAPSSTATNRSTVVMNQTTTTRPFTSGTIGCTALGAITLANVGTGVAAGQTVNTRIDFHSPMPKPNGSTRTFYSTVEFAANGATATVKSKVTSNTYALSGSTITVYTDSGCLTPFQGTNGITITPGTSSPNIWIKATPMEPYRLRLLAKGYGPNGAFKKLETVIQRNFFNNVASSSAISMIGPGADMVFEPGTAATLDIVGGTMPAVGVTDQDGLDEVNGAHTNGTISPAPAIMGEDLPDWQRSAAAMDEFIRRLRQTAQNNGRHFTGQPSCSGANSTNCFGNYANGTGLTFCDSNCDLSQNGGGILVVTGTLEMKGNVGFRGLIIVTGTGGVERSGNGNSVILGNLVIAPYLPNNLGAGFSSPRYQQNGGAGDVVNDSITVNQAFDGSSAISDFVLGIAEK